VCELLGISSKHPASWGGILARFGKRGGATADNPDGWGLAYRTSNAWQLNKAPEAASGSARFAELSESVQTDLLIAHVRKANPPSAFTLENTHPFLRNCCGRQWVFAHNGKVPEVTQPHGCCHPENSVPGGETDSEHAFFYLLDEIANMFHRPAGNDQEAWLRQLASLSTDIASYGQFNFLMSDGSYLIAYGHDRLHRLLTDRQHGRHTLLASEPVTRDGAWEAFQPGELQVYKNGELIARIHTSPADSNHDS
jgi:predicted glutamine amidotransferase